MADMTQARMRVDARVQWPSWIDIALGVWLIVAPFALGYSGETAPLWNDIIFGIVVGVLALIAGLTVMSWPSLLSILAGIWLIIAPFALSYDSDDAMTNDIVVGIVVIVFAALSVFLKRRGTPGGA